MDTRDAYAELGLEPGASDAQLKASWRRLVAAWHPDRNASADAGKRMQSINKAYQHLRQLRDGNLPDEDGQGSDRREAPATTKTAATHVRRVRLTLEDAILGCTRTLRGQFSHRCEACVGTGERVMAQVCSSCQGSGAVRKPTLFGWLWNEETCKDCGGDGRQRETCNACEGKGERTLSYRRRVRFPAGVRDGFVLSAPGGSADAEAIDLELQVELEPHPFFVLDAEQVLRCELPVNGYAWMAGRWIEVPTPDGVQQMRLNRDALVYRLKGQGFPVQLRGPRGDYLLKLVPVFPGADDPGTQALLDQLIERSSQAQDDSAQPLGQWQQQLRQWSATHKDRSTA